MATLTIPDAPLLPEIPVPVDVPRLNLVVPEINSSWAYEQYTNLLLDLIITQMENVEAELNNIWALWEGEQVRIWSTGGFDLVTALGYFNPLLPARNKEILYLRSIYGRHRTVISEAIRTRNLKLYLGTRLAIEKQKQEQYAAQKELELVYAKELVENAVTAYDLALKVFTAQVAEFNAHEKRVNVVIEQNDLRTKLYEALITAEQQKVESNKNVVALKKAEVQVQQALLEVANANLEAERVKLKVKAMEIDIQRLQIQALITGSQVIAEQARQTDITADIAIIGAEIDSIRAALAEIQTLREEAAITAALAAEKIGAYDAIIAEKTAILAALEEAQREHFVAEREYIEAQVEAALARIPTQEAERDTRIAEIDAKATAASQILNTESASRIAEIGARNTAILTIEQTSGANSVAEARARGEAETDLQDAEGHARVSEIGARGRAASATIAAEGRKEAAGIDARSSATSTVLAAESDKATQVLEARTDAEVAGIQAEGEARLKIIEAKGVAEMNIISGEISAASTYAQKEALSDALDWMVKRQEYASEERIAEAQKEASEALKNAKIINRFTEYRS